MSALPHLLGAVGRDLVANIKHETVKLSVFKGKEATKSSHISGSCAKKIRAKQIYKLVHNLYFKADLLKPGYRGSYILKVHIIRKYFKTQLISLGVQGDYVHYIIGHTIDVYHDIQMRGIEYLRSIRIINNT